MRRARRAHDKLFHSCGLGVGAHGFAGDGAACAERGVHMIISYIHVAWASASMVSQAKAQHVQSEACVR